MTGWVVIIGLALLVGLTLWRFARFDRTMLQFLAAALLLAMAGYAWQGTPRLAGQPAAQAIEAERPETAFAALRSEFLPRFDYASRWLIIADSYQRRGKTEDAVAIIRSGLRESPDNAVLWIGLGNALVIHGRGTMTPAAELAYRRAMALAPEHPAPRFFYGISLVQGGEIAAAREVWSDLLADAPADARWRPLVADRVAILDQIEAMLAAEGNEAPPR